MASLPAFFAFLLGFFPPLSIAGANAAFGGFLLASVAAREPWTPRRTFMDGPVLAFMAAWLLSAAAGLDPAHSLGKAFGQARFVWFYALVWIGAGRHRETAMKGMLWGAGAAVAYGLAQYVVSHLGLPALFPALFAADGPGHYMTLRGGRVHGATHPLTYAETILPAFFFAAAWVLEADARRDVLRGLAGFAVAGLALALTQSRGPWLGAALGLLFLLAARQRRLRLLAPLAFLAGLALLQPALRTRAETLAPEHQDESSRHRLVLWNNTWQVAKRHLLLGVGTAELRHAVERHRAEPGFLPNPLGKDGDAHNQFLQHLAERGLPGLAALLAVMGAPLLFSLRALRAPAGGTTFDRAVPWALAAYFLAFPVMNLTERVFDDAEPACMFWMLAAALFPPRRWEGSHA